MLATELNLPVVIHSRNMDSGDQQAIKDVLSILADWVKSLRYRNSYIQKRPGVLHSFSSDIKMAESAIQMNFMIGFTGPVTFKNADAIRKVVTLLRLDELLLETDSPFLTPHPHRGRRNEPAHVRFIADKISRVRQVPYNHVVQVTSENAKRLFNW